MAKKRPSKGAIFGRKKPKTLPVNDHDAIASYAKEARDYFDRLDDPKQYLEEYENHAVEAIRHYESSNGQLHQVAGLGKVHELRIEKESTGVIVFPQVEDALEILSACCMLNTELAKTSPRMGYIISESIRIGKAVSKLHARLFEDAAFVGYQRINGTPKRKSQFDPSREELVELMRRYKRRYPKLNRDSLYDKICETLPIKRYRLKQLVVNEHKIKVAEYSEKFLG